MTGKRLKDAVRLTEEKILNREVYEAPGAPAGDTPVLVILAAGKGTRFGTDPKCIQPVHGTPLARHSIDAFRRFRQAPVVCLVGYRHEEVSAALGPDNVYVLSDNPTGGTAFAAYEAFCVPELVEENPPVILTMGDRIVPPAVFEKLWRKHTEDGREAELTFLTAVYEPPKNRGKGRVLRDESGAVQRIVEERDIDAEVNETTRQALRSLTEGNCPLYVLRAATLERLLRDLTADNAQGQFYLTDIVERISREGGEIRTITTKVSDPEYDLLSADVTRPMDLALLEGILSSDDGLLFPGEREVEQAAAAILAGRPGAQVASIARQLEELVAAVRREKLTFHPESPVGIGISGGRLRIAFMHPDMVRFFGPAWQMPIGAGEEQGEEQIIVVVQETDDRRIHLFPMNPEYRESVNSLPSDTEVMYPGEDISDLHQYEVFGTRMSETLLLSLGYFSDREVEARRREGLPLPPPALWVSSNMRRPFALVGNAIASLRTLRTGNLGARVREHLGKDRFRGLRLVSTGNIPQGGFSSSSAVTVATKNAINSLFGLGIPPDLLVHLACQAEYGTGVRAGSLDQATEQKGSAGKGTLISSNPRDNYRIIGTYPVPAGRFQIVFPYSVDRDREAWRWSWGAYGDGSPGAPLTTSEMRKMTGKAAEIAALLTRLPLGTDFFKVIEEDLVRDGELSRESREWTGALLRDLPLLMKRNELIERAKENQDWYAEQLTQANGGSRAVAAEQAAATMESLFSGWRDPVLRRHTGDEVVAEEGVPLRAMVAYLFAEVAKNFYLLHHTETWIESVTRSQTGDRCVTLESDKLPPREEMMRELDWERGVHGAERMNLWLERHGARPFDFNRGLDDASLAGGKSELRLLEGSNFFRGLALIDLAEAMLKRAFGNDAVAVRVNAAGQGDYFQVHVDTAKARVDAVKRFLSRAFYRRFGLQPAQEFVELHAGAGAAAARLSRFDELPRLVRRLRANL